MKMLRVLIVVLAAAIAVGSWAVYSARREQLCRIAEEDWRQGYLAWSDAKLKLANDQPRSGMAFALEADQHDVAAAETRVADAQLRRDRYCR